MELKNTGKRPIALTMGGKVVPLAKGETAEVDDAAWADAKKDKVVAAWIEDGDIEELGAAKAKPAPKPEPAAEAPAEPPKPRRRRRASEAS